MTFNIDQLSYQWGKYIPTVLFFFLQHSLLIIRFTVFPGVCLEPGIMYVCVCALCYITGCDSSEGMCADRPYIILSGSLAADRD